MPEAPTETHARPDAPTPIEIDWLKTLAGALAAVTTAVLLSTLGAVGTLIGAALGSVGATVGSALYARGLTRSRQTVRRAQESARTRLIPAATRREPEPEEPEETAASRFAGLPWRRIALVAVATFAVVVVAITTFEAVAGRSVSSYTGGSGQDQGSTIGGVTGNSDGGKGKPHKPQHSEFQTPSQSPSGTPSEEPSQTPSTAGTPTETPSESTTPTPSETPTPTDTATSEPTTSATP